MSSINNVVMEAQVLEALRTCYDPEIPVNIYELGLVYEVNVDDEGVISIKMTLASRIARRCSHCLRRLKTRYEPCRVLPM